MKRVAVCLIVMVVVVGLSLVSGKADAEMVDGVWFGVEGKTFFFFNATWGLSRADVKTTLQEINRPTTGTSAPLTQYREVEQTRSKNIPFHVRGKIIERDGGIDYLCSGVKKDTYDYIFRFVFEDERLSEIYIKSIVKWKDPDVLYYLEKSGGGGGYGELLVGMIKYCTPLNNSDSDFSIYGCNNNLLGRFYFSLPKNDKSALTLWPAWTEMTRDKIYKTGLKLNTLTNKKSAEKTTVENQPQNISPEKNHSRNIEFYNRSVLELLN